MPKQIDDARMRPLVPRRDELVQKPLDLRPHALERAHRGEERGELSGSHGLPGKRALEPRGLGAVAAILDRLGALALTHKLAAQESIFMSGSDLGMRRRRALWRATHRGSKEMDFLLGRFAERDAR